MPGLSIHPGLGAWPDCAICNKPVDQVLMDRDICRAVYVYTLHCHGATEVAEISDQQIVDAKKISIGRAFVTRGIGEQRKIEDANRV